MSFLSPYYTQTNNKLFSITALQGNNFAKQVADDYNPIHHSDSKRFCVPGDLLFAIALNQYGLYEKMTFRFLELVKADSPLLYPPSAHPKERSERIEFLVVNERDKPVLGVEAQGEYAQNATQIEQLVKKYVAFSGRNFPHILVPLMKAHNVMINPKRPLVIYESMTLEFSDLNFEVLDINLGDTTLDVDGKRGVAKLYFSLQSDRAVIGSGVKTLLLSGLREYDEVAINEMCEEYLDSKP